MILTESRRLRIGAFTALYFCQGIPIGLLDIALPGWLAQSGMPASQIAAYTGVVGLPWAFKLVAGPFMDRFRVPAMGNRRPWVMGAQFALTLMLVVLAVTAVDEPSIGALMVLGFLVNCCGATQDVAVDGMAIDLLPIEERGRANAFMGFGQVLGFSTFGALAGWLLGSFGLAAGALVAAALVGSVFLFLTITVERRGERRLPWSEGRPVGPSSDAPAMLAMFSQLLRSLMLPQGIVLAIAAMTLRGEAGIFISVMPVLAVQGLGYTGAQYSATYGWIGATAAGLGLLAGPLIDRFGARRLLMVALTGAGLTAWLFAASGGLWQFAAWPIAVLFVYLMFEQVVFISLIAQFMNITWPRIAATQFAVYMAFCNLSRSGGAGLYSFVADSWSFERSIAVMGALSIAAAVCLLGFGEARHAGQLGALRERLRAKPAVNFTENT